MNVLIGCEESQEVCKVFRAKGHDAFSCDLEECSGGHPEWHLKLDVFDAIRLRQWDLGVFFPPCTHLAVSGAKHFEQKRKDGRQQQGIDFFMKLTQTNIRKVCIENPVGIMSTIYKKPTQIVQPWFFGDPFTKTTCLWLKGLPKLNATNIVDKGKRHITKGGNSLPDWYNLPPGAERAKIRSKTFKGIAEAMANQWDFK